MKVKKYEQNDIKTWNSQQSDVDLFSKMQGNFLQKYFRYNISDHFNEFLLNIYQDMLDRKVGSRNVKSISSHLFIVKATFVIEEFEQKVQNFYRLRSKSVETGELPYAFRLKYCNRNPMPNIIKEKELVFVQVKIKAQVAKIQDIASVLIKQIQSYKPSKNPLNNSNQNYKSQDQKLHRLLSNYSQQYFNIFICYFGDFNFHIFNKQHYQVFRIQILGRVHNLRIFVFYISRQAMVETFKTLNKITNLEYINDLVIQFYQMKREKNRNKRLKKQRVEMIEVDKKEDKIQGIVLKAVGAIGLVAAGYFIFKLVM